jgi:hypothetical protein
MKKMPTETEINVMKIISAIEIPTNAAKAIESMGTEAVTVLSEVALGTYPVFRTKIRSNAVALVGQLEHPQSIETMSLLVKDSNPDISIRAMRAAGRRKMGIVVDYIGGLLKKAETSPILAAEAANSLINIDSPAARTYLETYNTSDPNIYPHRGSTVVKEILRKYQSQK